MRLQTAVRIMIAGSGKTTERLKDATYPLADLGPTDFPANLRERAARVLELRDKYGYEAGGDIYFHRVKPSDRKRFAADLLALYEACLIDLGRSGGETESFFLEDDG